MKDRISAFPRPIVPEVAGSSWTKSKAYSIDEGCDGMTLRDYFAAKCMQGMMCDGASFEEEDDIASFAYKMADAMLKERDK